MPVYPSPETWEHANPRQAQRAARSFAALRQREVPVFSGPLFVEDDEEAHLQPASEVARRTLVLWAVALRAEGMPQRETLELIRQCDLESSVSPSEKAFLHREPPDPEECARLGWRLESIWALLWTLGIVEELSWPGGMCNVAKLVQLMRPQEKEAAFITNARLRPTSEILDAQDLIMRIHWAIRDAYLNHGGMIPEDLDWSGHSPSVPLASSEAVGVVEQRHWTLNWLTRFMDPQDWDHVDTPT